MLKFEFEWKNYLLSKNVSDSSKNVSDWAEILDHEQKCYRLPSHPVGITRWQGLARFVSAGFGHGFLILMLFTSIFQFPAEHRGTV